MAYFVSHWWYKLSEGIKDLYNNLISLFWKKIAVSVLSTDARSWSSVTTSLHNAYINDEKIMRQNIFLLFYRVEGIFIFRRKTFFERKIFNSVIGVFFLFLKLPMTLRVQVCRIVGVLYNECVSYPCVCKPVIYNPLIFNTTSLHNF